MEQPNLAISIPRLSDTEVGDFEIAEILSELGFEEVQINQIEGNNVQKILKGEKVYCKDDTLMSIEHLKEGGIPFFINLYTKIEDGIKLETSIGLSEYIKSQKQLRDKIRRFYIRNTQKTKFRNTFLEKPLYESKEFIEKKLRGKVIMRVGIPEKKDPKTQTEFYGYDERVTQMIIITDDGHAQELTSHYVHNDNYRNLYEYPDLESSVPKFAIHEACHTIAIPVSQIVFKTIFKNTNLQNKYSGIHNQSFTPFTEMLVEALAGELFNNRGQPSSDSFNYGISISEGVVECLRKKINVEKLKKVIQALSIETHKNYLKQINSSALIIQKSSNISEISNGSAELDKIVNDKISDLKPISDTQVNFDLNVIEGMASALLNIDYSELSREIKKRSLEDYYRSVLWESKDFDSGSHWKSNFVFPKIAANEKDIHKKQYNEAIVDGFKIWYNSLSKENKIQIRKDIFEDIDKKIEYEKPENQTEEILAKAELSTVMAPKYKIQIEFYSRVFKYFESDYRFRKNEISKLLETKPFEEKLSKAGISSIM
jgi:hypothetical protein